MSVTNDIVFVSPPISTLERYGKLAAVGSITPPLGLCYIASVLETEGFDVSIVDAEVFKLSIEETVKKILSYKPKIVGITSTMTTFHSAIDLGRNLRKVRPDLLLMLGGPYVSALKILALDNSFDFGVYGEGEDTVLELINHITGKNTIPISEINGLIYKKDDLFILNKPREYIKNLDTIPYPARHLLPDLKLYLPNAQCYKRLPVTTIITGRGCPYNCIFCDHSTFGKKYRQHSPEYVVEEIEILIQQYGIRELWIVDDTFTIDKSRVTKICDLIIEKGLDISWSCCGRVNNVSPEMLRKMRSAGCWMIAYGIESGNQQIMDFIKKGITIEQVKQGIQWTKEAGILAKGYFMIGHPTDTVETINETISFAKSLPLDYALFLINSPLPNTEMFDICKSTGKLDYSDLSKFSAWNAVYEPPGVIKKQLEEKHREAYKSFYLRPSYIWRQLKNIDSLDDLWRNFNAFVTLLRL
jgi:anaerobic magnesium-protoporphyrin IX monomethyl ester cyclase